MDGVLIWRGASTTTMAGVDVDHDAPGSWALSALDADVVVVVETAHRDVCGGSSWGAHSWREKGNSREFRTKLLLDT